MPYQLILIRGVPGSGKSTLARIFTQAGYSWYETDMYWEGGVFDPSKLSQAHLWCYTMVTNNLKAGNSVVVSNTFIKAWEIAPYIKYAKDNDLTFTVIEAKGNYQNVHGVPEDKVQRMREMFEPLDY